MVRGSGSCCPVELCGGEGIVMHQLRPPIITPSSEYLTETALGPAATLKTLWLGWKSWAPLSSF
jgi:hypothetical protein